MATALNLKVRFYVWYLSTDRSQYIIFSWVSLMEKSHKYAWSESALAKIVSYTEKCLSMFIVCVIMV